MSASLKFQRQAPGHPGAKAFWTSGAKSGVGTSVQPTSGVWFTLGHGIVNEVYCPEINHACLRDMGFIVTDGGDFFSEEKTDTSYQTEFLAEGVPAYRLTNECEDYRIEKEILTDPRLDVLLQRTRFLPLRKENDLHLYVLVAPRLGDGGAHNTGWIGEVGGQQLLFAARNREALALACSAPFHKCSAGFVGVSDGWRDLYRHKQLKWEYTRAEDGNIALVAEIDLTKCDGEFVLALGFDCDPMGAAHHARASLLDGFDAAQAEYVRGWQNWQEEVSEEDHPPAKGVNFYRMSATLLRVHTAKKFPGAVVASLSVPWGFARSDDDRGGYHIAWVRDLVEVAGGLLAADLGSEASPVLRYLALTQKADGSWPQNMWVNGKPYGGGNQMDETAFPVLLTSRAWRDKFINEDELRRLWPMVERALCHIVRNGPATKQDRWEENGGYSPFTLAIEIAALIEGAELMHEHDAQIATYLRQTADVWNENIERWCYATDPTLARKLGVDGYYVRIAPQRDDGLSPVDGFIRIKNYRVEKYERASDIVSPDALALVYLRSARAR
jgi:glucoamylase